MNRLWEGLTPSQRHTPNVMVSTIFIRKTCPCIPSSTAASSSHDKQGSEQYPENIVYTVQCIDQKIDLLLGKTCIPENVSR